MQTPGTGMTLGCPRHSREATGAGAEWMRGRGYRCLVDGVVTDHVGAVSQDEEFILIVCFKICNYLTVLSLSCGTRDL